MGPLAGLFFTSPTARADSVVGFRAETVTYFYVCSRHQLKIRLALGTLATANQRYSNRQSLVMHPAEAVG